MSRHRVRTVILAALVTIGSGPHSEQPTVTITGGSPAQVELALWAISRFEEAGLELPDVEIRIHDKKASCRGHEGTFNATTSVVNVCVDRPLVVLHELAHAWAHHELSDAQRLAYVNAGGFESWSDKDTAWRNRGSEDAANTIAWALLDQPITFWTPDGPIAQQAAAYQRLTGNEAPRLVADSVDGV